MVSETATEIRMASETETEKEILMQSLKVMEIRTVLATQMV